MVLRPERVRATGHEMSNIFVVYFTETLPFAVRAICCVPFVLAPSVVKVLLLHLFLVFIKKILERFGIIVPFVIIVCHFVS